MIRGCIVSMVAAGLMLTAGVSADHGVSDNEILLGQSCALKGPARALGTGMQEGLNVYFDQMNASGGINGRQIKLKTVNDGYEPEKCTMSTTMLIEKANVFLMIGGVGTPTAKVAVPICEANEVPFVAPFTGAEFLRNPYKKWVVNLRGSYFQEMEALAELLVDQKGHTKIACFYQNDGYGKAGLTGIEKALESRGMSLCATGTYERNTTAVAGGLNDIAASTPDAIVMVGAYKSCAAFIKAAKKNDATSGADFCNISFVGTKALGEELGADAEGCIVSQVVPYPWDDSIPVVAEYHAAMKSAGKADSIGFISLEGYLAGKLFCMALENIDGEPTREAFIESINSTGTFDLGGITLGFSDSDHQGMDDVFITVFQNGKAVPFPDAVAGASN